MNKPLLIAHRGASTQAPENTQAAFLKAWECGADGVEGDFRLTADGQIVCFHDAETLRISDLDVKISEATLRDLKEIDIGSWYDSSYAEMRILTLREFFEIIPEGKQAFVEVKVGCEIVGPLLEEIDRADLPLETIKIISFQSDVIAAVRAQRKDLSASWIVDFHDARSPSLHLSEKEVLQTLEIIGADGLSANYLGLKESLVQKVLGQGYPLNVWAVDLIEEAQRLQKWGVTSITTNDLNTLKKLQTL